MKRYGRFQTLIFLFVFFHLPYAFSETIYLEGDITGTNLVYQSNDDIELRNSCTIKNGADVIAAAYTKVVFQTGTRIENNAKFTARMIDNDGFPNLLEIQFFGDLSHYPDDDFDGDRLSNLQECLLGFDPTVYDLDNDDDGLPDWWEINYLGGDLSAYNDILNPGCFYIYDVRGRVSDCIKIQPK